MSVASRCKTIQNVSYFPTYKRLIFETRKPRTWGSDLGFRELIPASISQEFGISLDGTWMTSEKFCVCKAKRMEIVCDCSFFYGSYCYGRICFFQIFYHYYYFIREYKRKIRFIYAFATQEKKYLEYLSILLSHISNHNSYAMPWPHLDRRN